MPDLNLSLDPLSAICNAIVAGCEVAKEYIKFLQTPEGQKVAAVQLKDLEAFKVALSRVGDLISQALAGVKPK